RGHLSPLLSPRTRGHYYGPGREAEVTTKQQDYPSFMNIKELAEKVGASAIERARGDEELTFATGIEDGVPGAVSFIGNALYEKFLPTTKATAVIVTEYLDVPYEMGRG